jgi:hypothetical protein
VFEGQLGSDFQGDYFLYHHTHGDTVDRLVPEQMDRAAAAMSAHIYAFATMPQRTFRIHLHRAVCQTMQRLQVRLSFMRTVLCLNCIMSIQCRVAPF